MIIYAIFDVVGCVLTSQLTASPLVMGICMQNPSAHSTGGNISTMLEIQSNCQTARSLNVQPVEQASLSNST